MSEITRLAADHRRYDSDWIDLSLGALASGMMCLSQLSISWCKMAVVPVIVVMEVANDTCGRSFSNFVIMGLIDVLPRLDRMAVLEACPLPLGYVPSQHIPRILIEVFDDIKEFSGVFVGNQIFSMQMTKLRSWAIGRSSSREWIIASSRSCSEYCSNCFDVLPVWMHIVSTPKSATTLMATLSLSSISGLSFGSGTSRSSVTPNGACESTNVSPASLMFFSRTGANLGF